MGTTTAVVGAVALPTWAKVVLGAIGVLIVLNVIAAVCNVISGIADAGK